MPRYSALVVAFILVTYVHAIPLDEVAAHDGVGTTSTGMGNQADGGPVAVEAAASCPTIECALFDESVLKTASEDARNGGDVSSGAANGPSLLRLIGGSNSTNTTDEAPKGRGSSGAGGEARGGSIADNLPALIGGSNSTNSTGGAPQSEGSSGANGEAKGGSLADILPALIGLNSDNAKQGGSASSRNSSGLVSQADNIGQKGRKNLAS